MPSPSIPVINPAIDIGARAELRAMLKIAMPAVFAQLAQMSLGTIDSIMAGQMGARELAAVATGTNLIWPLMLILLGVFLALNPIIAHYNGAKSNESIARALQNSLWFAAAISLPVFWLWRHMGFVLQWLDVSTDIRPLALDYVDALSWGTPFLWGMLALRFCNEGLFANRAVMWVAFLAVPLQILLNWLLMYGHWGMPELGAVGVGYATSCVWFCMFCSMLAYTFRAKRHRHLRLFAKWYGPQWHYFKELLQVGTPMGLAFGMEVLMFSSMGLMMATYDTTIIAAHQIALNFASLTFMVPLGISSAITARVGFAAGAGSQPGVRRAGKTGILLAAAFMTFSASIMIGLPHWVTAAYTQDATVQAIAVGFLFLAGIFQFSDGLQVSAAGALRGLKDTRYPMIICFFAYWIVGFPSGWLFAHYTSLGPAGYWAGMIGGLSMAAVLLNWRFHVLSKRWGTGVSAVQSKVYAQTA